MYVVQPQLTSCIITFMSKISGQAQTTLFTVATSRDWINGTEDIYL